MSESERPTVYLHIGAPKTGTTYLQHVVSHNRELLRRNGVLYPGRSPRSHFLASQDLREWKFQGYEDPRLQGAWQRMVDEARQWPGRILISHESFASATGRHVDRAMSDLDFADVHLIFTARDMARQLPAAWQERVRNRGTTTFGGFLAEIRRRPLSGPAQRFWALHGTARILSRWSREIPPERVHLVTVPPSGSDRTLLWDRFAQVLGIDPGAYDTDVQGGTNSSLGAAEAAVLRRFNEMIADVDVPWPLYAQAFKRGVAPRLGARRGERIALPEDAYQWAVNWSRRTVTELRTAGYDVVGDLNELIPTNRPSGLHPDEVEGDVQADVAIAGMAMLFDMLQQRLDGDVPPVALAVAERARARMRSAVGRVDWPEGMRRGYRRLRGDAP